MKQDEDQIKILVIFHFVVAGIASLFACLPILHLAMEVSMLTGSFFQNGSPPDFPFPLRAFGFIFTVIPAAMMLFGWAFAIALAISGYFLAKKQHYLFCMTLAGISCTFLPFGTVLGLFTLIVLMRPSVKELFNYPVPKTVS